MTPKYTIGQFVVTSRNRPFEISEIHIRKGNQFFYCGGNTDLFAEEELTLYTEPKPKVKKWFYLLKWHNGDETMSIRPFTNEDEIKQAYQHDKFKSIQRLDWSMVGVDDNE